MACYNKVNNMKKGIISKKYLLKCGIIFSLIHGVIFLGFLLIFRSQIQQDSLELIPLNLLDFPAAFILSWLMQSITSVLIYVVDYNQAHFLEYSPLMVRVFMLFVFGTFQWFIIGASISLFIKRINTYFTQLVVIKKL